MLKMVICMDDKKINFEKKYRLDGIYGTIDSIFSKMGFPRVEDVSGSLVYQDNGHAKDYGRFGKIVNTLKKQAWFMDNVAVWLLCDSDDSDSPDDFNEEDLLNHYRTKAAIYEMAGDSVLLPLFLLLYRGKDYVVTPRLL